MVFKSRERITFHLLLGIRSPTLFNALTVILRLLINRLYHIKCPIRITFKDSQIIETDGTVMLI